MHHEPAPTLRTERRVLNAVLSDQALTNARLAAFDSKMLFKDYLNELLLQAKPISSNIGDQTISGLSATPSSQKFST